MAKHLMTEEWRKGEQNTHTYLNADFHDNDFAFNKNYKNRIFVLTSILKGVLQRVQ